MLTYQLGGCISGEGTASSPSPTRRRRAVSLLPPHSSNNRKIVAMSNSGSPRTYTLFGKICGSFNRIISIFDPINRPY